MESEKHIRASQYRSTESTVVVYKLPGVQDCGNYREIKLMSHTMKIWERIIDRRLREETTIGDKHFVHAIFALRQLLEKYRGNRKECIWYL